MKIQKIFLAIMAVAFIASSSLAIDAYTNGDKEKASHYGALALLSAALPVVPQASKSLGFFGQPGLEALKRNANRFDNDAKEQLTKGNAVAYDYTLYIRRQITGLAGVYRTIEADNVKTKGITNIDGNRLPQGDNVAIEAIWIAEGNHATSTDPKNIVNYTNVASSVQAEFRHAELVILQDSKEILRLPISSMLAPAASINGSKKDVAYHLKDNCPVLVAGVPFEINIEFPAAMATFSTSTNKFHLEIELFCKKTGKKMV